MGRAVGQEVQQRLFQQGLVAVEVKLPPFIVVFQVDAPVPNQAVNGHDGVYADLVQIEDREIQGAVTLLQGAQQPQIVGDLQQTVLIVPQDGVVLRRLFVVGSPAEKQL